MNAIYFQEKPEVPNREVRVLNQDSEEEAEKVYTEDAPGCQTGDFKKDPSDCNR